MLNHMKKTVKQMIKIFFLIVSCSVFFYLRGFSSSFVGQFYACGTLFLIVPTCIKSEDLPWLHKCLYSFVVCFMSTTVILIFNGIGKVLFNFVIVMGVVLGASVFMNLWRVKNRKKL